MDFDKERSMKVTRNSPKVLGETKNAKLAPPNWGALISPTNSRLPLGCASHSATLVPCYFESTYLSPDPGFPSQSIRRRRHGPPVIGMVGEPIPREKSRQRVLPGKRSPGLRPSGLRQC